jgi:hypothetical protein
MKPLYFALLAASGLFVTGTAQAGPIARGYAATHYRSSVSYVSPYVYTVPTDPVYVYPAAYSYPVYSYGSYGRVYHTRYAYSGYRRGRR